MKNQILQMKYHVSKDILNQNESGEEFNQRAKDCINNSTAFALYNISTKLREFGKVAQKAVIGSVVL